LWYGEKKQVIWVDSVLTLSLQDFK
jgi:hypothetical protein